MRAPQAFFVRTMPQTQRQHGKSNKITLPQHSTTSGCRQVKSSSFGQKPFPYQRETSSSGRKTKILFRKLGKINSRCEYFVHCAGFQNSFLPNPISVWSSPISKGEPRGKVTNKFRNKGNVEERCNSTGEIRTWGISEQFFLSKQEGWRSSTCNKSQISEQLHTLPTFQNGRDAFNKGSPRRTRLFDKDRSKRCLFWHTSRQKLKKMYSFSMERKLIQIPLPMFWPVTSPSDFHKTSENPNCLIKEDQRNNNIFKRHASNGSNVERNFTSKGDLDFCVTKFRFCDKFEKGTTDISVENRVFGVSDNFNKHDVSLTSGYPKQMHATYSVTKDHNYGITQNPRETLIHCSGVASSENSVQVLSTTTNSGSERNKFLSKQNKIKPTVTGRVEVVVGEFTFSERQTTGNRNATVNNRNGCFQNRLGAVY